MVKFLGIVLLALAPLSHALAADLTFPQLTGRVMDEAGLLSPAAQNQITGWLAQFEQTTKRQVVVATVTSLQGDTIEDYGYRLGRAWGIGEKDKNTGAILLVAPNEHKVRIEVGYGLEGELTDAIGATIINQDILPAFRQGNYEQGIVAGTAAMLQVLGWNGASAAIPVAPQARGSSLAFIPWLIFLVFFIFVFARLSRHHPFLAAGLGMYALGGGFGGRGGFGGGGGGFGGGFSGGGGSFGGGGASGGW